MEKFRVIELFGGIGAPHKALNYLSQDTGLEFEVIDMVEFDPQIVDMYNAIHGTKFKPQDVLTWDKDITCDYLHASTPCQAFSIAGKGLGKEDERGAPLWEATIRIIKKTKPKYITLENVVGLTQAKHIDLLEWYLNELEKLGYKSTWKILNATDFGSAQQRKRVFVASSNVFRPDLDKCVKHKDFTTLRDILEPNQEWHTYDLRNGFLINGNNLVIPNVSNRYTGHAIQVHLDKISNKVRMQKTNKIATIHKALYEDLVEGGELGEELSFNQAKSFYDLDGVSGTLRASPDTTHEQKVLELIFETRSRFWDYKGYSNTLSCVDTAFASKILDANLNDGFVRWRQLTALECVRLTQFSDFDYIRLSADFSDNAIIKACGNSIVVGCMYAVLRVLFKWEILEYEITH